MKKSGLCSVQCLSSCCLVKMGVGYYMYSVSSHGLGTSGCWLGMSDL